MIKTNQKKPHKLFTNCIFAPTASVFGRVLLRSTAHAGRDFYRETRCRDFMHRFISSDIGGTLSTGTADSSGMSGVDGSASGGSSNDGGGGGGDGSNTARINAIN